MLFDTLAVFYSRVSLCVFNLAK